MIPPHADAEFVAGMEEVLDTYAEPHDRAYPKLNMDEQPVQLTRETRTPIPATADHPKRVDYEYERAGTASIFMFCEAQSGWRQVAVRERRTKVDWADEVANLLRTRYAEAKKVILICDNLNTHTKGAFYEAFDPMTARELVKRLESFMPLGSTRDDENGGRRWGCQRVSWRWRPSSGQRPGDTGALRARVGVWPGRRSEPGIVVPRGWGTRGAEWSTPRRPPAAPPSGVRHGHAV